MSEPGLLREFKKDNMVVKIYEDNERMGEGAASRAAELVNAAIGRNGRAVIILATGASQFTFFEALKKKDVDWSRVVGFHLDEYAGMADTHPASFRKYLYERFVNPVGLGEFHPVMGDCGDMAAELLRLSQLLRDNPVDVSFVGIGENGHLAFNDPPADFETEDCYLVVDLDEKCRKQQLGEGWFKSLDEVPTRAISMSVSAIMKSRSIICTVPDERKAWAVRETLNREIAPMLPATILRRHPDCVMFLDKPAAGMID